MVVLLALGAMAYVRLAPSDPARWHRMPDNLSEGDFSQGAVRVVDAGEDGLARLDRIIRDTARSEPLAGSVEQGIITYISRSRIFGFPDYTTLRQRDGRLELYARARFGKSDLGVNAARLDRWLEALAQRG
ncbi:uncharacterized protein DUF1499 [Roseovarius halotolerans]|uniref:DUF1499 domain-containing protein n=2 Tax=Roseovarius halotolerans TaxID=505353 RepID=A0A1X6YKU1_9RHOB|nr:DUF1499 domain-containing protein [Roseovarius halotolerans]RKT34393.1 uncharacterized protein DUF1499 [Roseovarius halotolerans]SLN23974.1 hypothetical protein ROH8110_00989 [Roseovarius halotolerans]